MTKYNKDYGYEVDIIDIDGKKQNMWKLYNLKHGSVIFESTDYNEIIERYVHHRIQDRFGTQEVPNGKKLQFEANIRAQLHLSGQEHPGATLRDYIPFSHTAEAKITPKRYKEYRDLQFSPSDAVFLHPYLSETGDVLWGIGIVRNANGHPSLETYKEDIDTRRTAFGILSNLVTRKLNYLAQDAYRDSLLEALFFPDDINSSETQSAESASENKTA